MDGEDVLALDAVPAAAAAAAPRRDRKQDGGSGGGERSRKRQRDDSREGGGGKGRGASSSAPPHKQKQHGKPHDKRRDAPKEDEPEPEYGRNPALPLEKFKRVQPSSAAAISAAELRDKKIKAALQREEKAAREAAVAAARAELLLTEEAGSLEAEGPMERTYRFKQADVAAAAPLAAAKQAVNLTLDTYGPYRTAYSRNGRYMLLGGEKGHIAVVDWHKLAVSAEFHVRETVRDVVFLHNSMMFAVAQKKYAYIYDHTGMELHALKHHVQPLAIDFLPFHFLLASVGNAGYLTYQDVSTGQLVAQHRTKLGACGVMRQNPWNAVEVLGHGNGTVTMWTPNMTAPVVKMLAHRGPVSALAVDPGGRYLVTSGLDARLKVWDVRRFREEPLFNYFLPAPATSIDVSQRGCVAVGYGGHVQVWGRDFALERDPTPLAARVDTAGIGRVGGGGGGSSAASSSAAAAAPSRVVKFSDDDSDDDDDGDGAAAASSSSAAAAAGGGKPKRPAQELPPGVRKASAPYMRHDIPGSSVTSVRFRPFDDFLAVGHTRGLASLLVPGSGEPNYDSREADPFQTAKGRREAEVKALLDKLPPSSIALDPRDVGGVDRAAPAVREREARADDAAREAAAAERAKSAPLPALGTKKAKKSAARRKAKRQANIVTAQRQAAMEKAAAIKAADAARVADAAAAAAADAAEGKHRSALSRFYAK